MICTGENDGRDAIIESLLDPTSYVHSVDEPVVLHETHISWVLLAGDFAYKIKKPMVTDFLDYGSLSKRHHACCEELRLGNRYASGMYLDIVPITFEDGRIRMDGDSQPIEFAVRMRRFEEDALLSHQLTKKVVSVDSMVRLANTIADFHSAASKLEPISDRTSEILAHAQQNFDLLLSEPLLGETPVVRQLEKWTLTYFENHRQHFVDRSIQGFIRECHGDLHCGNIAFWRGQWVPFDGIEFNTQFSWIDVISDIAFLVMDLRELGHPELAAIFLNAYLEQTGDFQSLSVLRWYLVYRAMVRAKVAVLLARQRNKDERLRMEQITSAKAYIRMAKQIIDLGTRKLWITHGVSGSGKTTGSQKIIEREGAIRVRSDVERKRLFKTSKGSQSNESVHGAGIYSPTATATTYNSLFDIAKTILQSDFNVIVDATFLNFADRKRFHQLAKMEGAEFWILDFQADEETLKQRITHRRATSSDASDATLEILSSQLKNQEPLSEEELHAVVIPAGSSSESPASNPGPKTARNEATAPTPALLN